MPGSRNGLPLKPLRHSVTAGVRPHATFEDAQSPLQEHAATNTHMARMHEKKKFLCPFYLCGPKSAKDQSKISLESCTVPGHRSVFPKKPLFKFTQLSTDVKMKTTHSSQLD